MKCSPQLKKAYEGMQLTYKLNTVLAEMPKTTSFNTETLERYLNKKGVSPKEAKASGILDMYNGDYKFSASEWQSDFAKLGNKHHISKLDAGRTKDGGLEYDSATLGHKGHENPTYKETAYQTRKQLDDPKDIRHYESLNKGNRSVLGWNRTHVANVNGTESTVLNELQSDWAKLERDGLATFKSNVMKAESDGTPIVNDFPMSEKAFNQLQIVDALDQAVKNGTNRVVIPTQRENELVGTAGVTKFYENLNKSILPDVRKKLERQGFKIKSSTEAYLGQVEFNTNTAIYGGPSYYQKEGHMLNLLELAKTKEAALKLFNTEMEGGLSRDYSNEFMTSVKLGIGEMDSRNQLHVLEIVEVPNTPVNWNVYSLLGSLGLAGIADKLQESEADKN